jgi:hypothetical protein
VGPVVDLPEASVPRRDDLLAADVGINEVLGGLAVVVTRASPRNPARKATSATALTVRQTPVAVAITG